MIFKASSKDKVSVRRLDSAVEDILYDNDADVDVDDRTVVDDAIGRCAADINGGGEVDGADLAFILSWWGVCSP